MRREDSTETRRAWERYSCRSFKKKQRECELLSTLHGRREPHRLHDEQQRMYRPEVHAVNLGMRVLVCEVNRPYPGPCTEIQNTLDFQVILDGCLAHFPGKGQGQLVDGVKSSNIISNHLSKPLEDIV